MGKEIQVKEQEARTPEPALAGPVFTPQVDVIEKPDALEVLADVPGATKESCDVVLEQGRLTIQAEVEEAEEPDMTLERREYDVGSYYRSFALGRGLDAEGVEATFQNGVLRLLIPKGEAYKPRRIEIQGE